MSGQFILTGQRVSSRVENGHLRQSCQMILCPGLSADFERPRTSANMFEVEKLRAISFP
jgi:hypothetical protein